MKEEKFDYALRMGDTCLVLSHRLAELCSKGPFLEEDIALTNISLDLLGRCELFLEYAAELEGKGRKADDLYYRRNERQYFNQLLAERPNKDYAFVIMRQFLSDAYMLPLMNDMKLSKDERFAAIAEKGHKETAYHFRHSSSWIVRLAQGTEESRKRIEEALDDLWTYTGEMFEETEGDRLLAEAGIIPSNSDLKNKWLKNVKEVLEEAGLELPGDRWMASGGRSGEHSEYLGHMIADMQYLVRAYPNDKW